MTLLDSIKGEINSMVIDKLSNYLSIARGNTSNAITAALPLILSYLTSKAQSDAGAEQVLSTATDAELRNMFEGKTFQELFERNRNGLMAKGNSLVMDVLGNKNDKFSEEIGKYANIPKEAASGMLSAIMPLILGVIGDKVTTIGAEPSNLRSLLNKEKESFFSAIPAGLASAGSVLGFTEIAADPTSSTTTVETDTVKPVDDISPRNTNTTTTQRTYTTASNDNSKQGGNMLKWLLPLLGIIVVALVLYFLMRDSKNEDVSNVNTEQVTSQGVEEYTLNDNNTVVNAAGEPLLGADGEKMTIDESTYKVNDDGFVVDKDGKNVLDMNGKEIIIVGELNSDTAKVTGTYDRENDRFIYDLGNEKEFSLPNGETLTVGENSTEAKLINFLSDDSKAISEDEAADWIVLDRVYFETNTNNLDQSSLDQLNRISTILKAYPTAKLKLGGYTDNTGNQEVNQPLSDARAKIVMKDLVKSGIKANRLAAEGYGAQHFVCPTNDTPACKAQNRRVDIKVTAK